MLARVWRGRTPRDRADEFEAYLRQTGGRDIPVTAGNRGAYFLRRDDGDEVEFSVISLWDSEEAIARFAGGDAGRFRYYPRDHEFLLSMPADAEHFDVRWWTIAAGA